MKSFACGNVCCSHWPLIILDLWHTYYRQTSFFGFLLISNFPCSFTCRLDAPLCAARAPPLYTKTFHSIITLHCRQVAPCLSRKNCNQDGKKLGYAEIRLKFLMFRSIFLCVLIVATAASNICLYNMRYRLKIGFHKCEKFFSFSSLVIWNQFGEFSFPPHIGFPT